MADPGLKSKFIAMQQEDVFGSYGQRVEARVDNYSESRRLDIARVRAELKQARHPRHRKILQRALKELESR